MIESDIQKAIQGHVARNRELKELIVSKGADLEEARIIDLHYLVTLYPPPQTLKEMSLDTLKGLIQLKNDRDESRNLVHIELPKTQADVATFFFSRLNEKGEPLLTPSSKKFGISFDPDVFRNDAMGNMRFEFDVSKLIRTEEVAF